MTPFEALEEKYGLQDIADSAREDLEGNFFPSKMGKVSEAYIRLIPHEDNEYFSIAADFSTKKKVSESDGEEIADEISDKFFELLQSANSEDEVDLVRGFHDGTTVFVNGEQVY
jgi:hypothetical protein